MKKPDLSRALRVLACAAVAVAAPAVAEDDPAIPMTVMDQAGSITQTRAVPAAGLLTAADAGRLDRRLAVAVREVCGYNSMHGLRPPAAYRSCRNAAIADVRRQVGFGTGAAQAALAPPAPVAR